MVELVCMLMLCVLWFDFMYLVVVWVVVLIEEIMGKFVIVIFNVGGFLLNDIFLNGIGMLIIWVLYSYIGCF